MSVQDDVINFLLTLNLTAAAQRETLVIHAGLDQELLNSIDYAGAPYPFVTGLVSAAKRYGQLANGQDAVVAVLLAARNQVGLEGQEQCDGLIREWLSSRATAAHSPRTYHGATSQVDQPGIPPFQAPRTLPDFVGREDQIERLVKLVQPGARAAITGITGMGGLGKTELAKVVAARVAGRFADGVLWADCANRSPGAIADLWAAEYGLQLPGDDEPARVAAWRSLVSRKTALLVLDNVGVGQVLEPLFPPRGRSAVLITTQEEGHLDVAGANKLILKQFRLDDTQALVDMVLGAGEAERQAEAARQLHELTGGLPLAVAVALHMARECGWELATLNDRLRAEGALPVLGEREKQRKSLNATFQAAWQGMEEELQVTLAALSWFGEGTSFGTAPVALILDVKVEEAGAQLARLAGRSLLTRTARGPTLSGDRRGLNTSEGRWMLHTLLRTFLMGRTSLDDGARWRMAGYYAGVLQVVDVLCREGGGEGLRAGMGMFDLEWPHIRALQAWAAAQWEENDGAAALCSDYAAKGAHCLGVWLHARERINWLEAASGAARRMGERRLEGRHLNHLGIAYNDLGDSRRAIEHYEQALAIACELGDRGGEGAALGNLGIAYWNLGETRRAIEYSEQALAIAQEIGNRQQEGGRLNNLGLVYATLGDGRRAVEYYKQALAISRESGDRQGERDCVGNLGNAYAAFGETQRAIECHEAALAISREIKGRRGEGADLGDLGNAYTAVGDVRRAVECYEEALAITREVGDRRNEGNNAWNLGLLFEESDPARAADLMSVLVDYEREIGRRDVEVHARQVAEVRARAGKGGEG